MKRGSAAAMAGGGAGGGAAAAPGQYRVCGNCRKVPRQVGGWGAWGVRGGLGELVRVWGSPHKDLGTPQGFGGTLLGFGGETPLGFGVGPR